MTEEAQVTEPASMDKLVRVYRKMRDRLQELDREYTTKMEEIKVQQDAVKDAIKAQMQALGSKSVSTPSGTAILSKKVRYSTQDWDSFKEFMVQNNALDLLEKRIAQTNMDQFLEENPTLVPPGLNSDAFYDVSVRKPTK
jgi:hypothetical protein